MSNSNYEFVVPAVRGVQAGRVYYTVLVPFGILKRLVSFDTGNVLDRSQRDVNPARAKKLSQYIQNNVDSYVLTSLAGVINGKTEFIEASDPSIGQLKVSMDAEILLFDGQHRTTGIIDALKQNSNLSSHSIPIMLFLDMNLTQRQQAFSDTNGHTVKPSTSINDTYNQRDDLPKLIVRMSNTLPVFEGLVDFERNVIGRNSGYLFTVKTIKDATAKLLSIRPNASLSDDQKEISCEFWSACDKPLLWENFRSSGGDVDEFRNMYISSHGVFLNALGVVGKNLLKEFGNLTKIQNLSTLNITRNSADFVGRCIDKATGNMMSNANAINLTAIKMLQHLQCPIEPELMVLERQYFPGSKSSYSEHDETLTEESSSNDLLSDNGKELHPYADIILKKWPTLTIKEVENISNTYQTVVIGTGLNVQNTVNEIQIMVNRARKPSSSLRTVKAAFNRIIEG